MNDTLQLSDLEILPVKTEAEIKDNETLSKGLIYDRDGSVIAKQESFTYDPNQTYSKTILPIQDDLGDWKTIYEVDKKDGIFKIAKYITEKYSLKTIGERREREMYIYENGRYRLGANMLRAEIQSMLEELASSHLKNEVIEQIKDLSVTERKEFNVESNLINIANGVLDITTNSLLDHKNTYLFLHIIPVKYIPEADCPGIKKFLYEILNEEDVAIIQEWLGYALYRSYFIKKALILVGERDPGKTTLIRLFSELLGKENISGVSLQRLVSDKFSAAHLFNKHINIYDDLSFKDVNYNGAFKIATGGGIITGEYKFGEQFQFENYSKLTFACNKIPNVKDTNDDAYFNRWIIIPFNKTVLNPDKFLINKLTTPDELSGLLNFALSGLKRLLDNQEFSYKKEPDEIKTEMLRSGSVIANFAYDCLEEKTDEWVSKDAMYSTFVEYAKSHRLPVETINNLGKKLPQYATYITDRKKQDTTTKQQITGWRNVQIKADFISVENLNSRDSIDIFNN